jgi:hypothetical protein
LDRKSSTLGPKITDRNEFRSPLTEAATCSGIRAISPALLPTAETMSVDIRNSIGSAHEDLATEVNKYFEDKNVVKTELASLNELIGFPYLLKIDWREFKPN